MLTKDPVEIEKILMAELEGMSEEALSNMAKMFPPALSKYMNGEITEKTAIDELVGSGVPEEEARGIVAGWRGQAVGG